MAEHCISILFHTIEKRQVFSPNLRVEDYQAQTCIVAEEDESTRQRINNSGEKRREGDVGKGLAPRLVNLRLPICTRVHRKQVDIETLKERNLPWEWDRASPLHYFVSCVDS